jgi:hypothetical protein
MRRAHADVTCSRLSNAVDCMHERACGIDRVVDDQDVLAGHVADDLHLHDLAVHDACHLGVHRRNGGLAQLTPPAPTAITANSHNQEVIDTATIRTA